MFDTSLSMEEIDEILAGYPDTLFGLRRFLWVRFFAVVAIVSLAAVANDSLRERGGLAPSWPISLGMCFVVFLVAWFIRSRHWPPKLTHTDDRSLRPAIAITFVPLISSLGIEIVSLVMMGSAVFLSVSGATYLVINQRVTALYLDRHRNPPDSQG